MKRDAAARYGQLNEDLTGQLEDLLASGPEDLRAALHVRDDSPVVADDYRAWKALSDETTALIGRLTAEHEADVSTLPLQGPEFDGLADIGEPLEHGVQNFLPELEEMHDQLGGRFASRSVMLEHARAASTCAPAHEFDPVPALAQSLVAHDGDWFEACQAIWPQMSREVLAEALHRFELNRSEMLREHASARGVDLASASQTEPSPQVFGFGSSAWGSVGQSEPFGGPVALPPQRSMDLGL